jgi:hypothetical protein
MLRIAETGVKPSSGYMNLFESVNTAPTSMTGTPSNKMETTVHVIEMRPGNCPRQTANEIRYSASRADNNCSVPVDPPYIQ